MGTECLCRGRLSCPGPEWPAQVLDGELQAHLSCSALDPGAGICELLVSSVSWLPARLQGRTQRRESLKGRETVPSCSFLFLPVCSVCATLVIALHPGICSGSRLPAFGGTPSSSLTAAPPQRPGFNSGTFFLRASRSDQLQLSSFVPQPSRGTKAISLN